MAKRIRKLTEVARQAVQPAVQVVQRTRTKLSRGQPRISGGQVLSALGGAVAGSVASHFIARAGVSKGVAALGVAGLGGVGAYMLDGRPQAAAIGAAAVGVVSAATAMVDAVAPVTKTIAALPPSPPSGGALPPKRQGHYAPEDVQAAFDAARDQLRRQGAAWPAGDVYEAWPEAY